MNTPEQIEITAVFRRFRKGGEVIALFPEVPADRFFGHCLSYMHVGQHGAASVDLSGATRPANENEFSNLLRELRGLGYRVNVRRRITRAMHRRRLAALA